ncbi:hypothetical protein SFC66_00340 [Terribacillus saccharophilus]|uniref:hypothetical protein n=1 Tax=Terribacillus saccharophilus TaxID=361277 RepID=UPI0039824B44
MLHEEIGADADEILLLGEDIREEEVNGRDRYWTEEEYGKVEAFQDKYYIGSFETKDGDTHHLTDFERGFVRAAAALATQDDENPYGAELDDDSLDRSYQEDYREARAAFKELLKIKSEEELPSDLIGKYPDKIRTEGVPEELKQDSKEVYNALVSEAGGKLENDSTDMYDVAESEATVNFIELYNAYNEKYGDLPEGFVLSDGKHYMHNEETKELAANVERMHPNYLSSLTPTLSEKYREEVREALE